MPEPTENTEVTQPVGEAKPADKPDVTSQALDAVKAATEAIAANQRQTEQAIKAALSRPTQTVERAEPEPVFEDVDGDVKKMVGHEIGKFAKSAERVLAEQQKVADARYQSTLEYQAAAELDRCRREIPEFGKLEAEVIKYVSGVSKEVLASPGAYREAYHAVYGKHATEERIAASTRPNANSPQRIVGERRDAAVSIFSDIDEGTKRQAEMIFGGTFDPKAMDALSRDDYDIDAYRRDKAARAAGGRK